MIERRPPDNFFTTRDDYGNKVSPFFDLFGGHYQRLIDSHQRVPPSVLDHLLELSRVPPSTYLSPETRDTVNQVIQDGNLFFIHPSPTTIEEQSAHVAQIKKEHPSGCAVVYQVSINQGELEVSSAPYLPWISEATAIDVLACEDKWCISIPQRAASSESERSFAGITLATEASIPNYPDNSPITNLVSRLRQNVEPEQLMLHFLDRNQVSNSEFNSLLRYIYQHMEKPSFGLGHFDPQTKYRSWPRPLLSPLDEHWTMREYAAIAQSDSKDIEAMVFTHAEAVVGVYFHLTPHGVKNPVLCKTLAYVEDPPTYFSNPNQLIHVLNYVKLPNAPNLSEHYTRMISYALSSLFSQGDVNFSAVTMRNYGNTLLVPTIRGAFPDSQLTTFRSDLVVLSYLGGKAE